MESTAWEDWIRLEFLISTEEIVTHTATCEINFAKCSI